WLSPCGRAQRDLQLRVGLWLPWNEWIFRVSIGSTCSSLLTFRNLISLFVTKLRVELNPGHVGLCDARDMASRTYVRRLFRGGLVVGQWVMPEGEEPPAVSRSKPLTVFHRHVNAVVLTVEIPAPRWFGPRSVRIAGV